MNKVERRVADGARLNLLSFRFQKEAGFCCVSLL